ncbi:MAG: DUF1501 domain-containing protein [Nocardioidaceae bacterium]|nr:DUF1501 domain-containing protein [Nocardioidaceae bacterium]
MHSRTTPTCGCTDFRSSRRGFLKGLGAAAGAGALTSLVGDVFTQASFGAEPGGNVLVVLSLRGGSDGLSLVVPHGDPGYAGVRPTIGIPTGSLLVKDPMFGLHPGFQPLAQLWQDGTFGAIQSVGMPQPDRSHFSAMERVEDADPGSSARVGWINRMVGLTGAGAPNQAIQLGTSLTPTALVGPASAMAVYQLRDIALPGGSDLAFQNRTRTALEQMWTGNGSLLGRAMDSTLTTTRDLAGLAQSDENPANGATYPAGDLAESLQQSARLIRADVGTQVVAVDFGSWDHHEGLGTVDRGDLQWMVRNMAQSLAAFFVDLGTASERVTVVTISEFGRTVSENGSAGAEHGYGNCMLLLGAGVKGGQVHGRWPGLRSAELVDGDLAVSHDYRSVLAEVVARRFPSASMPQVFPGFTPETVGVMR